MISRSGGRRPVAAPTTSELVPLAIRVRSLFALRIALVTAVVLAPIALPRRIVPGDLGDLLLASALYLLATLGAEMLRWAVGRDVLLLTVALLFDGVYLAYAIAVTGGQDSVLRTMIVLHLVAVTLVVSYRTGLKVAAWHLILLTSVQQVRGEEWGDPARTLAFGIAVLAIGAGAATFSAVNERELRRRRADIEALHAFAVALDDARHPTEVAEVLIDHAAGVLGVEGRMVVGYRDGEAAVLAAGGPIGGVQVGDTVAVGPDGVLEAAWAARSTVLVRTIDPESDPWLASCFEGATNIAVVPLFADGQPAGVLVGAFGKLRHDRVERTLIVTAEQLAAHGALALRNAWLLHDVERLAITDGLTRLANRRHLETSLRRELARARDHGTPLGFVIVDLDRFKALNDAYGHTTGDEVLQRVAEVLRATAKLGDTVARYGGEEFALVLPGCDGPACVAIAEQLRSDIESMPGQVVVTASLGIASFPADAVDEAGLVLRADEALYESKRAGRNRVSSSTRRASGWLELPWRPIDAPPSLLPTRT